MLIRSGLLASLALALAACSDEPYEAACQQSVLANRQEYAQASPVFDYELSRTHYFSNGTAESVTVYYLELGIEEEAPRRVRISCFGNTDKAFVYAFVKDELLGPRVVGSSGETLPSRPKVNPR